MIYPHPSAIISRISQFVQLILFSLILLAVLSISYILLIRYLQLRFLSSQRPKIFLDSRKGILAFKIAPLIWGCLIILRLGEHRAFSDELISQGLSPEEVLVHNFVTVISNITSLSVNVSLIIRKKKNNIGRYLIISSAGFLLRRIVKRVIMARDSLKSYLSSLGFELELANREDYGLILRRGFLVIPKIVLSIEPSKAQLVKINSTMLASIKNTIMHSPSDYTLLIVFRRFPKISERELREESNRSRIKTYKFGVYLFYDIPEILSKPVAPSSLMGSIINYLIPIADVKKIGGKSKLLRTSMAQFVIYPRDSIRLLFEVMYADKSCAWTFMGLLSFMLASVEEEVLPRMIISDDLSRGDIKVGYQLVSGRRVKPFYLNVKDLSRHILIVGPTGAGKTTLAKIMISQLINLDESPAVWVFDFHGEYTFLRDFGFIVISPGKEDIPLGLNIFDPRSEEPEIYAYFLSGLLSELVRGASEGFSPQMERIVSTAISDVVLSGEENRRSPLFFLYRIADLCEELSTEIPSAKFSLHAIFNRLKSIFSGVAKHVFWVTKTNLDIKSLLKRNIVFDLSYFSSKEPTKKALWILVNVLLRYLYSEIIGNFELSDDRPRIFIVLEEARYVAPAMRKEESAMMYAAEDLVVLGRKYGISLCFITQSADSISKDVIDNAGTLFMMGDAPPEIIREAFSHVDSRYLQIMPAREALVKMSTRSVLTHIRLIDPDSLPAPRRFPSPEIEGIIQNLRENYSPIRLPYEKFILKLITREISLGELTSEQRG